MQSDLSPTVCSPPADTMGVDAACTGFAGKMAVISEAIKTRAIVAENNLHDLGLIIPDPIQLS
ncbi:hypothetical protein ACFLTN_07900 [Chloroflexota bacterium]